MDLDTEALHIFHSYPPCYRARVLLYLLRLLPHLKQVKLLEYDPKLGFRQMIPKLLTFMKHLPPDRLVVKLDGSDVMLSADSGGGHLAQRWLSLGGGVVFSAEASLFFDVGAARDDCSWMARYPPAPTVYRFLNAGSFMGTASDLRTFIEKSRWFAQVSSGVAAFREAHSAFFSCVPYYLCSRLSNTPDVLEKRRRSSALLYLLHSRRARAVERPGSSAHNA